MKNQPITVLLTISIFKQTMEEKSLVVVEQPQNVHEVCNPKADITMYVNSEEVRQYNPVLAFLNAPAPMGRTKPYGLLQSRSITGSVRARK